MPQETALGATPQQVRCCIAGGGPAGMMLGFLLARAGVEVAVLEKHADFLRDFRGDTIHPSTLEVIDEFSLLDEFLRRPHQEVTQLKGQIGETEVTVDDLRRVQRRRELPTRLTQRLQVLIQERVIRPVLGSRRPLSAPWPLRLLQRWPWLRRIPARLIGLGFRPEHVQTPALV
jgi:glycine/D-amino acid oxidase-like deaminating enzyme